VSAVLESVAGSHDPEKPSLTPVQVAEIRKRVEAGEKKARLAAEYQISRQTLYADLG
jgi:hypothetical protein